MSEIPRVETDDHHRAAVRRADTLLRDTAPTRRSRGTKGAPAPSIGDLADALTEIAAAFVRPITRRRRAHAERRAALLLARTIDPKWGPPNVCSDERLRAAFRGALDAFRDGHPTGFAALLIDGLDGRTNRAGLALAECLLGEDDAERRSAVEILGLLPGRTGIMRRASSLWPTPDPRMDDLRLSVVRHVAAAQFGTALIGTEIHLLSEPRVGFEAARAVLAGLDAEGLDAIACTIRGRWREHWRARPVHERHAARDLMLTATVRAGRIPDGFEGALDELDDESLTATIERLADTVRQCDPARCLPAARRDGPRRAPLARRGPEADRGAADRPGRPAGNARAPDPLRGGGGRARHVRDPHRRHPRRGRRGRASRRERGAARARSRRSRALTEHETRPGATDPAAPALRRPRPIPPPTLSTVLGAASATTDSTDRDKAAALARDAVYGIDPGAAVRALARTEVAASGTVRGTVDGIRAETRKMDAASGRRLVETALGVGLGADAADAVHDTLDLIEAMTPGVMEGANRALPSPANSPGPR